jgi:hypothetical protein
VPPADRAFFVDRTLSFDSATDDDKRISRILLRVAQIACNLGRTKFDKRSDSRNAATLSIGMASVASVLLRLTPPGLASNPGHPGHAVRRKG